MNLDRLKLLYKDIILEQANNPQNTGRIRNPTNETNVYNPSCGDKLHFTCTLDKNKKITAIAFEGEGCSISQASASMMTQVVKGKSTTQAIELSKIFSDMAMRKKHSQEDLEKLWDAQVLINIMRFPARIKCATLSWWALDRMLLGEKRDKEND